MVIKKLNYPHESCWSDARETLLHLDTGSWRTTRPVVDVSRCTYCGLCALYCPPQCMTILPDHFEADLDFCKGCGICARECPRHCITMAPEG